MNLEDHAGDVVRKARAMAGVSAADAARAAGVSTAELEAMEDSGKVPASLNLAALAGLVGLHPVKLESIAKGWLPSEKDLGVWRELRQISTTEGGNTVHAYLVWDEVTREAAVFDTGWDATPILQLISDNQLQLRHIFITHTHVDHMAGLNKLREAFPKAQLHTDARSAPPQRQSACGI